MEKVYLYIISAYEKKLNELMGKEEFNKFVSSVAKETFKKEIESMGDSEFKDFCIENFFNIIGESNG